MSFLQKLLHATEAQRAVERGDVQEAIMHFMATHAIDQEDKGSEEIINPIDKMYEWLRTNGIELTEAELKSTLEVLEAQGCTFEEVE